MKTTYRQPSGLTIRQEKDTTFFTDRHFFANKGVFGATVRLGDL